MTSLLKLAAELADISLSGQLPNYLNSCMTTEVKVKLRWVCDGAIHCSACWDIATFPHLLKKYIIFKSTINHLSNKLV